MCECECVCVCACVYKIYMCTWKEKVILSSTSSSPSKSQEHR